jgi:hypothetical protein
MLTFFVLDVDESELFAVGRAMRRFPPCRAIRRLFLFNFRALHAKSRHVVVPDVNIDDVRVLWRWGWVQREISARWRAVAGGGGGRRRRAAAVAGGGGVIGAPPNPRASHAHLYF